MEKLKKAAQKALSKNKGVDEVYVTSDGYPFISKNAADLHASTNKSKKKLKVHTFSATQLVDENADKDNSKKSNKELTAIEKAKLRASKIQKLDTIEAIDEALKGEKAKTVIEVAKARKVALSKAAAPNSPEQRDAETTNLINE